MAQQKIKTQDVSEILRRAKQEFISRETAADPYEEDCVVRETDPDEKTFPKHEPNNAQLSSIGKNKPSNLSQHTQSTVQQPGALSTQKSPNNRAQATKAAAEGTENLLKGAYMREQKQQQRQQ